MTADGITADPAAERPADDTVDALRAGDEANFRRVVAELHPLLVRLAAIHCPTCESAEEAAQETWVAVLRGLDGFEGRSSLRTWVARILVNIARRRAGSESRPEVSLDAPEPAVPPERFAASGPYAGHWVSSPGDWSRVPEDVLLSGELLGVVDAVIATLPETQRLAVSLRDREGWEAQEVCDVLGVTRAHQRVLLHRGRSRVREAVENYLATL